MPKTILPIANGFYVSDSLPISAQECVNFFPVTEDVPSLNQETLRGTPGISQVGTTGTASTDANRGAIVHDGVAYFVNGGQLYSMESVGILVEIGDVIGTAPVSMATNGSQLIIVPPGSGTGYIYTSATSTFEAISDGDFIANGNPRVAAFIDGYFVLTTDSGSKFIVSALHDGLSYNALDFGSAEADPDGVLTPIAYKNQLFICGTNTIEAYTNIGGAGFPFQRSGLYLDQGITSVFSIINANDTFIFVGAGDESTPMVWQFAGNQTQKISTLGIDRVLREILPGDQIRSWYYSQNGQLFVGFVLNTTTIVYDLATGKWHERKSRLYDENCIETIIPNRVAAVVSAHGVIYGADTQDGRIGLIDMDITEEYNSEIIRTFATQPFQNNMDPFFVPMIELTIEQGTGGGGGGAGGGLEPDDPFCKTVGLDPNVVFFYKMNELSGTIIDYSGYDNDSLTEDITLYDQKDLSATCVKSVYLNGQQASFTANQSPARIDSVGMTFVAWIDPDVNPGATEDYALMHWGNSGVTNSVGWYVYLDPSTGAMGLGGQNRPISTTWYKSEVANAYDHLNNETIMVTLTHTQGEEPKMYINGLFIGNGDQVVTRQYPVGGRALAIGKRRNTSGSGEFDFYAGYIANAYYYNIVKSPAHILELYESGI
jgi:hypothetical protein